VTRRRRRWLFVLGLAVVLVGDAFLFRPEGPTRREAVPFDLQIDARPAGYERGVRYFPRDAAHVEEFEKDYLSSLDREMAALGLPSKSDLPPSSFLAISGTASQVFVYPAAIKLQELAARERAWSPPRGAPASTSSATRGWTPSGRRSIAGRCPSLCGRSPVSSRTRAWETSIASTRSPSGITSTSTSRSSPPTFKVAKEADFDTQFMQALFETGERLGADGVHWSKRPPVLVSGVDDEAPEGMQ
jgi:hypothetical protein